MKLIKFSEEVDRKIEKQCRGSKEMDND